MSSLRSIFALTLFFVAIACAGEADSFWSAWRGAAHDGVARVAFETPKIWPTKLNVVWEANVGAGFSSPITDGALVFLQHRSETEERLSAFDVATGKKLWETIIAEIHEPQTHDPAATPAVFWDGSIIFHSIAGGVYRFNASDGKRVWKRDLQAEWKGEKFRPMYGVASSPIRVGETIVLPIGDKETGKAIALKVSDGTTAWEHATSAPGYSSFMSMRWGGQSCVATLLYNELAVFKKEGDGFKPAFAFKLPGGADGNSSMPVSLGEDRVLLTSHDATVALKVLPGATGCEELWRIETGGDLSTPVFANGRIYLHNSSDLLCIDPADGKTQSRVEMDGQYCALIVWGDVLMCRLHDGELKFVAIKNTAMRVLASYPAAVETGESWSMPMPLSPTTFVVRTGTKLRCFSLK